jgi:hypothetical protein
MRLAVVIAFTGLAAVPLAGCDGTPSCPGPDAVAQLISSCPTCAAGHVRAVWQLDQAPSVDTPSGWSGSRRGAGLAAIDGHSFECDPASFGRVTVLGPDGRVNHLVITTDTDSEQVLDVVRRPDGGVVVLARHADAPATVWVSAIGGATTWTQALDDPAGWDHGWPNVTVTPGGGVIAWHQLANTVRLTVLDGATGTPGTEASLTATDGSSFSVRSIEGDAAGDLIVTALLEGTVGVDGTSFTVSHDTPAEVILSLDSTGASRWAHTLSTPALVAFPDDGATVAPNGRIYFAADWDGQLDVDDVPTLTDPGSGEAFVLALDPDGTVADATPLEMTVSAIVATRRGVVVGGDFFGTIDLGGTTLTADGSTEGVLAELDDAGAASWILQGPFTTPISAVDGGVYGLTWGDGSLLDGQVLPESQIGFEIATAP